MRLSRLALLASSALLAGSSPLAAAPRRAPAAAAPPATAAPARRPALIVAISVDQFSADLFSEYRRHYTRGLARLQDGAVFPQGFQSHAATETCPGHSTLMTGDRPARTGIIANNWFDPAIGRSEKKIYCAEDETDPASSTRNPVVSAGHLLVPTLGERMKRAFPGSRNVAVSAKDRAVMMMGGHDIDAAYWYRAGAFVTLKGRPLAPAAQAENTAIAAVIAKGEAGFDVPAFCAAHDAAVPVGGFTVGTGRFPLAAGDDHGFLVSPRVDAATVELALGLVDGMKLGGGRVSDVLSVSLSANDYVGHAYGTEGLEMCIQQANLDGAIGALLDGLDKRGIDYVVVLSADHGGLDAPERLDAQGLPTAVHAKAALSAESLSAKVGATTGIASPSGTLVYGDGAGGDYTVAKDIAPAQRARVIAALQQTLRADPQVALALTAEELSRIAMPTGSPQDFTLEQRARASFYRGRSGDVIALLKRGVVGVIDPKHGYVATHGSPWDYDRRVPILFWRKGMSGFEQPAPVETVDIAPTLAAVAGLRIGQGEMDGRCLDLDAGAGDSCVVR